MEKLLEGLEGEALERAKRYFTEKHLQENSDED